jgi:hypothetical protein
MMFLPKHHRLFVAFVSRVSSTPDANMTRRIMTRVLSGEIPLKGHDLIVPA